jgi:hypothetical protein
MEGFGKFEDGPPVFERPLRSAALRGKLNFAPGD